MKEAVGNSLLVNLALTLMGLVAVLLVATMMYSKTFKVKNRILNIMEKYEEYTSPTDESTASSVKEEIYNELARIGYTINTGRETCPARPVDEPSELLHSNPAGSYDFCLYKIKTDRGHYFHVIVYTHYDIPAIGQYLRFQIEGDTRTFYDEVGG